MGRRSSEKWFSNEGIISCCLVVCVTHVTRKGEGENWCSLAPPSLTRGAWKLLKIQTAKKRRQNRSRPERREFKSLITWVPSWLLMTVRFDCAQWSIWQCWWDSRPGSVCALNTKCCRIIHHTSVCPSLSFFTNESISFFQINTNRAASLRATGHLNYGRPDIPNHPIVVRAESTGDLASKRRLDTTFQRWRTAKRWAEIQTAQKILQQWQTNCVWIALQMTSRRRFRQLHDDINRWPAGQQP